MTKRETAEYPRVAAYPGPIVVTIRQAGDRMWDVNFNGMCGTVASRAEALAEIERVLVERDRARGADIVSPPPVESLGPDDTPYRLAVRVAELERRMGQDPRPIDLAYGDALKARLAEVEAERDELRSKLGASLLARDDLLFWVQLAIRRLGEDGGGETTINNARGVLERALGRHAPKPGPETVAWAGRLNLAVSNGSRGGPKGSA